MDLKKIIEMDKSYYMNTYGDRQPVSFEKGDGIRLTSSDGQVYTDFFAGIAVNSLGYNYPALTEALCNQAGKLLHNSNLYYIENQAVLAKMLVENSCADKAFICNTGAEANEGALKLAKKYFYNQEKYEKTEFITLKNSFHGRTLAAVAATGQPKYQKPYAPLLEKFIHVDRNDCSELKNAVNAKTAAIMIELIQGESGVHPLDREFVELARKLCDEYDALLIYDEVQTGVGRTGKLFAYEHYGIEPDIFTLAKGLGGGVTIGAVCAKEHAAQAFTPGDHGTTFGGNPFSTCAGVTVITELLENGVLENARKSGEYLLNVLDDLAKNNDKIEEVRGMGLMCAVEFRDEIAKEVHEKLFDAKYLVGLIGTKILRITPPLIVTEEEIDGFTERLTKILQI